MSERREAVDDLDDDLPAKRTKPASTAGQIFAGVVLGLIGGMAIATGLEWGIFVGFVLIGLGGIVSMIGVVAAGVRLGMDWSYFDRGR